MRDVIAELKALRLHGMAAAWADLTAPGSVPNADSTRWLIEHLLSAETGDRGVRSVQYQMNAARFPAHRCRPVAAPKASASSPRTPAPVQPSIGRRCLHVLAAHHAGRAAAFQRQFHGHQDRIEPGHRHCGQHLRHHTVPAQAMRQCAQTAAAPPACRQSAPRDCAGPARCSGASRRPSGRGRTRAGVRRQPRRGRSPALVPDTTGC